ncbi:TetR family transcriptional regulator [Cryobacterium sp. TmT2-59]|nr:TetR family transcriptional regulator [Cryobacterium sp. TmT2-59]TFD24688.1 TetR family transcriptional regulator [Cryobacterium sp. TMT2-23]
MSEAPRPAESRRSAQSVATRTVILAAAQRLMLERGYIPTSIAAIAAEAGVAVQTIYNSVGGKAELLSAVLDLSAAGPDAPGPAPESVARRYAEARTAGDVIRTLVDGIVTANERSAAVHRVIIQAAGVDADVEKLEIRRSTQRLHAYGSAASALRARRGLRSGLSDHEAAAAIWALGHPQAFRSLVTDLGWSGPAYRDWLVKSLQGALS